MVYQGLGIGLKSISLFLELIKKTRILRKGITLSQVWTHLITSAWPFEGYVRIMRKRLRLPTHLIHLPANTLETFLELLKLVAIIRKLSINQVEHKLFEFPHLFP